MNGGTAAAIYRLIAEQMAEAMIYSDTQGVIRIWNVAAEGLLGYSAREAIGQSLDLIIPDKLRAAHWAGFNCAMERGITQHSGRAVVTRSLTKSGNPIYVEMSFAVIADEKGQVIGSVAVARDATQRRKDERDMRERLASLQKLLPETG